MTPRSISALSAGVDRYIAPSNTLFLCIIAGKNEDTMPRQPKSHLGKPGFGLVCKFYEVLLCTELKIGRNYQIFRR